MLRPISIGLKLMFAIASTSSICFCVLIFSNWHWNKKIDIKYSELIEIKTVLNDNLKTTVVDLQVKMLGIPEYLKIDPKGDILKWIQGNYAVKHHDILSGRENYIKLYNRTERRDISKGEIVVTSDTGQLV
ncbi:MAG: hypothetical protein HQK66_14435, partial [Desulfamplus sp.]|nr:hypothetical protein [Desulfamplus sp.]